MANAKEELIGAINEIARRRALPTCRCAAIMHNTLDSPHAEVMALREGYSSDELEEFLESLDFDYDDGYGTQELFGFVWFTDGSWLGRHEYDGSESWEHHVSPVPPDGLASINQAAVAVVGASWIPADVDDWLVELNYGSPSIIHPTAEDRRQSKASPLRIGDE